MQDNINNFLETIFNFKMRIALFCQNSFLAHTQNPVGKFREKKQITFSRFYGALAYRAPS